MADKFFKYESPLKEAPFQTYFSSQHYSFFYKTGRVIDTNDTVITNVQSGSSFDRNSPPPIYSTTEVKNNIWVDFGDKHSKFTFNNAEAFVGHIVSIMYIRGEGVEHGFPIGLVNHDAGTLFYELWFNDETLQPRDKNSKVYFLTPIAVSSLTMLILNTTGNPSWVIGILSAIPAIIFQKLLETHSVKRELTEVKSTIIDNLHVILDTHKKEIQTIRNPM